MNKKKDKLPKLSSEHKEALRLLTSYKEFKSLESLFRIEENNIIIQSFKDNSPEPVDAAVRKGWQRGRLFQLRKILKTFAEVQKEKE